MKAMLTAEMLLIRSLVTSLQASFGQVIYESMVITDKALWVSLLSSFRQEN